jgi:hypothetical protein
MTTRNILRSGSLIALLWLSLPAQAIDLWGRVVWPSRAPAVGVELRLVQRTTVLPVRIHTNSVGRYGLYNLGGRTSDYKLQVMRNGRVVKEVVLPALTHNGRVPDIVMP